MAGILSGICGLYWLAKALFYDETNLPAILSVVERMMDVEFETVVTVLGKGAYCYNRQHDG